MQNLHNANGQFIFFIAKKFLLQYEYHSII